MQKIIQGLPILIVIAALGIIGFHVIESRKVKEKPEPTVVSSEKMTAESLPVDERLPANERQMVLRAFHAPEALDEAQTAPDRSTEEPLPVIHPQLLSEVEIPVYSGADQAAGSPLYFQKDFESLRTEALRNPDSEQNRAVVETLMQKRQQRLAQKRDVGL